MPSDMKERIAREFVRLARAGSIDRITVKDIVEACHITRQTFYYHFRDLLDVIDWSLRQTVEELAEKCLRLDSRQQVMELFLTEAVQAKDLIRHLLVVDPTQRYDAQQVLNHEWFRTSTLPSKIELGSAIRELRTFNTQRKGIIKQGYLVKQGHIIRNWKKRSFVLLRDELKYYKSETEKKPRGKICMEDILE